MCLIGQARRDGGESRAGIAGRAYDHAGPDIDQSRGPDPRHVEHVAQRLTKPRHNSPHLETRGRLLWPPRYRNHNGEKTAGEDRGQNGAGDRPDRISQCGDTNYLDTYDSHRPTLSKAIDFVSISLVAPQVFAIVTRSRTS